MSECNWSFKPLLQTLFVKFGPGSPSVGRDFLGSFRFVEDLLALMLSKIDKIKNTKEIR